MTTQLIQPLVYHEDSSEIFDYFAHMPWAIFLDSSYPYCTQGRYDIMSALPHTTLTSYDDYTDITTPKGDVRSSRDPFQLVEQYINKQDDNPMDLPFIGGALGYFSYDLAYRLETLPNKAKQDVTLPSMAIGIYDWCIVIDHHRRSSYLIRSQNTQQTSEFWENIIEYCQQPKPKTHQAFQLHQRFQANLTPEQYRQAFTQIQDYIQAGDCYQVNLTQRFMAKVSGCPWSSYQALRQANPAPFAGFMHHPDFSILSCSPERFLRSQSGQVETKPIKGTKARSMNTELDQRLAQALLHSEKDRAENVMIVDLLRHDLGKVCRPGSIAVPQLCQLESFKNVHHLVSTITGQLETKQTPLNLLRACFPGGSITGAPKIRAMEIIDEIEPQRRGVYCGSLAYYSADQQLDSNIAIRTAIWQNDYLYCAAGGGIVADSDCHSEYDESLIKIEKMLRCFEDISLGALFSSR